MAEARYSVGTWDTDAQGFTPQAGLSVGAYNITLAELRQAIRELRNLGYNAHRVRFADGSGGWDWDSDPMVLIERTDGESEAAILERWKR